MQVTATQAKNRFGAICAQAKDGPAFIEKGGRIDSVILSAKQYSELKAAHRSETLAQRKAQFEQSHRAWLAEQNQRFEAHGLWCDDMRVW
ncbi:type II toxin-antitoxin system Phd/YefM family antitoxin [Rhodoferax sp.]|uniref:type II toxin-antitoxin system Phd/YefM family antitoxin n=1 Tax=Rhodoferax sp. TaxID=50421 RepID=UPI00271D49E7|nr:type II toxin-antitoxin system Phd/YefM family antitoxin [Rhodoferax sp.]MDO8318031.1 type II toxin-antitoxin system Phd/YefM family antitoxin [Rhodoferax sp.]